LTSRQCAERWFVNDITRLLQDFIIQEDIECSCSKRCQLTKHDIGRNTCHVITLMVNGSTIEMLHTLLERRTAQWAKIFLCIHTVTRNCLNGATERHDIAENHDVTFVCVCTIEAKHLVQFTEQTGTGSLNTKKIQNPSHNVTINRLVVNLRMVKNLSERRTSRFQHP